MSETGLFGLPQEFPSDPQEAVKQAWRAIDFAHSRLRKRFAGLAYDPTWRPSINNTRIHTDTQSYLEAARRSYYFDGTSFEGTDDELIERAKYASANLKTRKVNINLPALAGPAHLAFVMNHENVHLWVGRQPVNFSDETKSLIEDEGADPNLIEYNANECLVTLTALESLKLLDPPISRVGSELLTVALNACVVKDLALPFDPNMIDKLFKITQGKFNRTEIDFFNKKYGLHPSDPMLTNFYEQGFLEPLGTSGVWVQQSL